jgi:chromosome condensin MukBEF ATPase and DNA-binding subunit MukB
MMSDLRDRNVLYARLEEVLGGESAGILMSHIPAETDLATRADVGHLEIRFEERMDRFEERMDRFEERMDRFEERMIRFEDKMDGFHQALREQTRTYMLTMTGVMASFAAVVVAAGFLN